MILVTDNIDIGDAPWRDRMDAIPRSELRTRVWVAGPEKIVRFDAVTFTVHAEMTRHRSDGTTTPIPRQFVFTDAHGRERLVYYDKVQPVCVHSGYGDLPDEPDAGWISAVQSWRLRKAMYPNEPDKWWPYG